jgi:hypothetical protein
MKHKSNKHFHLLLIDLELRKNELDWGYLRYNETSNLVDCDKGEQTMRKVCILWKTGNRIDIETMVLPYILNSKVKGWWDEVEVIIWGDSQQTIANEPDYQKAVRNMIEEGIVVFACKACADKLCVTELLQGLKVDVQYTGKLLSERLQDASIEVLTL